MHIFIVVDKTLCRNFKFKRQGVRLKLATGNQCSSSRITVYILILWLSVFGQVSLLFINLLILLLTEEPSELQSMGSQRVGHDLAAKQQQTFLLACICGFEVNLQEVKVQPPSFSGLKELFLTKLSFSSELSHLYKPSLI